MRGRRLRDGRSQTLQVKLGLLEEAEADGGAGAPATRAEAGRSRCARHDGRRRSDEELREQLGLPEGAEGLVVTAVDRRGQRRLRQGHARGRRDHRGGQQKVARPADLVARIAEAKEAGRKSLLLLIRRDGDPRFVALSVE